MTILERIENARHQLSEARSVLIGVGQDAIEENFELIFKNNKDIDNIVFGVKSSEYNDEGMYPGVTGPVVNQPTEDDRYGDIHTSSDEWMYDYRRETDPRVAGLKSVLELIGDDALTQIYGDEYVVIATRTPEGYEVTETHYAW